MVNILIADDHPLFRSALLNAMAKLSFENQLFEAETYESAHKAITEHQIDLVLLDLKMPGNKGLMGLAKMRAEFPHVAVVIVSATEDVTIIQDAKNIGAMGFVSKASNIEDMINTVESVYSGQEVFPTSLFISDATGVASKLSLLTPKQLTVLNLIAEGALNKQIGFELDIKETTVKSHITDIFRKLGINNRTQAALLVQDLANIDGDKLKA